MRTFIWVMEFTQTKVGLFNLLLRGRLFHFQSLVQLGGIDGFAATAAAASSGKASAASVGKVFKGNSSKHDDG